VKPIAQLIEQTSALIDVDKSQMADLSSMHTKKAGIEMPALLNYIVQYRL
jgi:hypothetical protein